MVEQDHGHHKGLSERSKGSTGKRKAQWLDNCTGSVDGMKPRGRWRVESLFKGERVLAFTSPKMVVPKSQTPGRYKLQIPKLHRAYRPSSLTYSTKLN